MSKELQIGLFFVGLFAYFLVGAVLRAFALKRSRDTEPLLLIFWPVYVGLLCILPFYKLSNWLYKKF